MSIRSKFGLRKRRNKKVCKPVRHPVRTEFRTQSIDSLYTYKDFLIDLLRHWTIKQRVYHPHIPTLIVEFVPIYKWSNPQFRNGDFNQGDEKVEDVMQVDLSHCDTIVSNGFHKFGAVLGTKLDPRLDHVINFQVVEGIEFGVGICDESQVNTISRRDFMCIDGGYGYYNYKSKSARMKPKYPPGLYYHIQTCQKIRDEAEICLPGDVLTMVIQREHLQSPGGGVRSQFASDKDLICNPMHNLKASSSYSLSFYKNGEDMGFHLRNLEGQFYMCLNYYFVESKIRLLSDYQFRRIFHKRVRRLQRSQQKARMSKRRSNSPRSAQKKKSKLTCLHDGEFRSRMT